MLNIFNVKKNITNYGLLSFNVSNKENTENNANLRNKSSLFENLNLMFRPLSVKEWKSSAYYYNKSYSKLLTCFDYGLNKLLAIYFNMNPIIIRSLFKRRRHNKTRYSANKVYMSRSELKHTNTNLIIVLFLYNKQKEFLGRLARKLLINLIVKKNKTKYSFYNKNRLFRLLKDNFSITKLWNCLFLVFTKNILDYSSLDIKRKKNYNIVSYKENLISKFYKTVDTYINNTKAILQNLYKFNYLFLCLNNLGILNLIQKIYDKKVQFKVVELKSIHLNSDVFSQAVALKLRDRHNKVVLVLRKAIQNIVKIPSLHTLITIDDMMKVMNKFNIVNTIKQQIVSGLRFEATGRLTRRLTAMRAVFKYRYAGSLKNLRAAFNQKAAAILRGFMKSNLDYSIINSYSRNGSFGLKTWISTHIFMFNFSDNFSTILEVFNTIDSI